MLLLAQAKVEDVSRNLPEELEDADDLLLLGCDSMLELDGEIYGKPADAAQATARWRAMRGTDRRPAHRALADGRARRRRRCSARRRRRPCTFADLSDDEIDAYVATGEPLAVAGAFTVDGLGGPFVERIEGDHHGVVGLSLPLLRELLRRGRREHPRPVAQRLISCPETTNAGAQRGT